VAEEARLVAKTICAVITIVDPDLIVLGGGIGRAPGFAESVTAELNRIAPVMPAIRVSALGTDAVTDGCLAAGTELAWGKVMTALPTAPVSEGLRPPAPAAGLSQQLEDVAEDRRVTDTETAGIAHLCSTSAGKRLR
jgi:predicted NBD/HSP70 family sugar kinase